MPNAIAMDRDRTAGQWMFESMKAMLLNTAQRRGRLE
jgi:hypothetical protein